MEPFLGGFEVWHCDEQCVLLENSPQYVEKLRILVRGRVSEVRGWG